MGTLDDAIREHLELKRKQGISQEELERQEAEALGRRSPAPEPPSAAPPPQPSREPEPKPEPAAEADVIEEPELPASDPESARNGSSAPEPAPEPAADGADLFDQDLLGHSTAARDEPVVRRTRHEPEADPEPADEPAEDFLEDTPDFLEETPEHDRLWFEQKPPKDFDFD